MSELLARSCATLRGCVALLQLGLATGFRLRGAYWSWRMQTAFGADRSRWPTPSQRRSMMFEYARWSAHMRAMR